MYGSGNAWDVTHRKLGLLLLDLLLPQTLLLLLQATRGARQDSNIAGSEKQVTWARKAEGKRLAHCTNNRTNLFGKSAANLLLGGFAGLGLGLGLPLALELLQPLLFERPDLLFAANPKVGDRTQKRRGRIRPLLRRRLRCFFAVLVTA